MPLPLLPGYVFKTDIGKTNYHKPQKFTFPNQVPTEVDPKDRNPKLQSLASTAIRPEYFKPAWVAYDKYVLSFRAVYRETLPPVSQLEKYRYHRCKIHYFLEDDTMEIIEDREKNSGFPQGTILSRHRVMKPKNVADYEGDCYTFYDLNVDTDLRIYGKVYRITDCDRYTRQFLTEIGLSVNDPIDEPFDPYQEERKLSDNLPASRKFVQKKDKLSKFLKFHPQILQFSCIWDDTATLFGSKRNMSLIYFLDDDTIQIMEDRPENSGRQETKVFLRRSRLPKLVMNLPRLGEIADDTVLNISGLRSGQTHYAMDTNPYPKRHIPFYTAEDLDVGIKINVHGRVFLLYDCDPFTKIYYEAEYGRKLRSLPLPNEFKAVPQKEIPSDCFNFGTPEDSMRNCFSLVPTPAFKDTLRFLIHDKYGYDINRLVFAGTIITDDKVKASRRFVISYFLSDDTIMINSDNEKNSGIIEGMYMKRLKILKPEQNKNSLPVYYTYKDFYIGAVLVIREEKCELKFADEYTLDYMEKRPDQFPQSDIQRVLKMAKRVYGGSVKLLSMFFVSQDQKNRGYVGCNDFYRGLTDASVDALTVQEILTLARYYAEMDNDDYNWDDLLSAMQSTLRKKLFIHFDLVEDTLQDYDKTKTMTCTREELYLRTLACRLPIPKDLLKAGCLKFPSNEPDRVKYMDFMKALDYHNNNIKDWRGISCVLDINWRKVTSVKCMEAINYVKFLNDLQ